MRKIKEAIKEAADESKAVIEAASSKAKSSRVKLLEELDAKIRVCTACPLHKSRTLAVPGEGKYNAKVMIIGEAPGRNEDLTGRPFVGSSGKFLDHVLDGSGFDRTDFFITNICKCRPPSNRTPKTHEIETCTSLYLFNQISLINPGLIVLLGGVAVKRMLGLKTVEQARGRIIEHEGQKFLATYHPAVRFYREDLAEKIKEDFDILKAEMKNL
ncbi:MAG: phage polymerase-related protein [Pedosphaera sp.]|nr:phage polymerase-related protein [Pedosphaera sp.]